MFIKYLRFRYYDCTGASVDSILGAIISINSIDEKWYKPFNDMIHTYIR